MTLLTIYMPSNRSLARSRDAIESALAYAAHVDARLIISDNSGDMEKRRWLEARSPRLQAVVSDAQSAGENWRTAFSLVETPFLLPMGDDDLMSFNEDEEPVDLATLPADVIGVRPVTQIWTLDEGVRQTERFVLSEPTPGGRFLEYARKARGNNASYYSIFRTAPFLALMRLFLDSHPTKGGYIDWAVCLALFAGGRLMHDPSLVYRYDLGRWAGAESLQRTKVRLFTEAGLPEDTEKFWGLLLFLDLYVLLARLPLDGAARQDANVASYRMLLKPFLESVAEAPDRFDETTRYIAEMVAAEQRLDTIFQLSVYLSDCIKPGLKDGYVQFYQAALAA